MFDTLFTGKNFVELADTPSTNSYAMSETSQEMPEGTVILSHFQSQGRGQAGNHWESQRGKNLTFSVLYRPLFLKTSEIFSLSKMVSLALREAISSWIPDRLVQIKWPNDILVDGQKIAGILIENQLDSRQIRLSVLGIGLNVNQRDFSPLIAARTCSIRHFHPEDVDLMQVLASILQQLEAHYLKLRSGQYTSLDRLYLQHLLGYQESRRYRIDGEEYSGSIIGVNQQGHLAINIEGKVRHFALKEIEFVWDR